ncbi:MAG: arsenate reductase ArsC [Acidobacteria bacterium]|nr:arsenate reductase ArsC [Acidobacteriota bacterium]
MVDRSKVLILCTGNSARSQMAEGLLRRIAGDRFEVESAGTVASFVRPQAIEAMREIGIDISQHRSKCLDEFLHTPFDHVITVCDNANETCPMFPGTAKRAHLSFDDPAAATGTDDEILDEFRRIRDEIAEKMSQFAARE